MVAGLRITSHVFVDDTAACNSHELLAEIDVIDPPTAIPVPGSSAVVPPAPVTAIRLKHAEHVYKAIL